MRCAPYAESRTFSVHQCFTTTAPIWPSAAGTTATSCGVAQPARTAAAASAAKSFKAKSGLGVDLHQEFGAAHAHDRRRRADLHRFGRLLHHLAGDRGEASLLEGALELARAGGRVEAVLVDREDAALADGNDADVGERDAGPSVGARHEHI